VRRFWVFENGVLRKIFGSKRGKVTGWWRRLHNKGALYSVLLTRYNLGDQVKKTDMGKTCSVYGGEVRCIQGFSGEA
jgi:hypothetical protein